MPFARAHARGLSRGLMLALALLGSCVGTETGNPPLAPQVAVGTKVPPGITEPLLFDAIWLSLDALAFTSCDRAAAQDVLSGPLAVDLVSGVRIGGQANAVARGARCGVSVALVPLAASPGAGTPAGLVSASVLIEARMRDGTRVTMKSRAAFTADLVGTFEVTPAEDAFVLALDRALVAAGLDLSAADHDPDGGITIDSAHNAALLAIVETRVRASLFWYADPDGDGLLDADEARATPLASPP